MPTDHPPYRATRRRVAVRHKGAVVERRSVAPTVVAPALSGARGESLPGIACRCSTRGAVRRQKVVAESPRSGTGERFPARERDGDVIFSRCLGVMLASLRTPRGDPGRPHGAGRHVVGGFSGNNGAAGRPSSPFRGRQSSRLCAPATARRQRCGTGARRWGGAGPRKSIHQGELSGPCRRVRRGQTGGRSFFPLAS